MIRSRSLDCFAALAKTTDRVVTINLSYAQLSIYLEQIKETRSEVGFETHEVVLTRLVHTMAQAAFSEVLTHYDVNVDVISVEEGFMRCTPRLVR